MKVKKTLPLVSIVTCSYNANISNFKKVLESIKIQNYPKNLIEHIVMDGGSTNGTIELAYKYGCVVDSKRKLLHKAEVRASLGIKKAKGSLIVFIETDNILTAKNWLKELVIPFLENDNIVCSYSAYNAWNKDMPIMSRYAALFGIPEPTLYYLHKSEKIRLDQKEYNKGKIIKETKNYWIVKFNEDNLPTIGDNGHMFLKKAIDMVNKNSEDYIHVDAFMELLDKGFDTYAVVKNSIIHLTPSSILQVVKQRIHIKEQFYNGFKNKRKYLIMDWSSKRDRLHLITYIFISFTCIIPLIESIRGYIKIRDIAWFLHPIICFVMVIGYGWSEISWQFKKS